MQSLVDIRVATEIEEISQAGNESTKKKMKFRWMVLQLLCFFLIRLPVF